jgi:transposase
MVEDLRMLLREFAGRKAQPTAMILDSRTLQSTPESDARAGYDEAKRRKGSKVHAAVDTLGRLLALQVTPANEQDRAKVGELVPQVQELTGDHIQLAYVDQGYTGEAAAEAAEQHGLQMEVVKHTQAKRGLYSCRRAGWWREASPGPPDSAAWLTTTSGSLSLSAPSTSPPAPASCSPPCSECSLKAHNRL